MQIAIVLYAGMTALDVVGPYEILRALPDVEVRFVSDQSGPVMTDSNILLLGATHSYDETPKPDVVLVGGSLTDTMTTAAHQPLINWLRKVHPGTSWTVSVCSGSVVLAAAGILDGRPATGHWAALPVLAALGAKPDGRQRVVRDGKVVTAAGVSAGIDLALFLAGEIAGRAEAEAIQLLIEYDPDPPFDTGHLSKASPSTKARAIALTGRLGNLGDLGGEVSGATRLAWATARRRLVRTGKASKRSL